MKYFLFIFLLVSKIVAAQPFITKVSATVIGKKDVIEVEYAASDVSLDQFNLPKFNNWTLISGPNLSSSQVITGNSMKQQTVYSVMLQPTAAGNLIVPGATALLDNRPKKSNAVSVTVKDVDYVPNAQVRKQAAPSLFDQLQLQDDLPTTQYLKKGETARDKIKSNIMVRLEVSKKSCYVGEPILATYKLCTRLQSKSKVIKRPGFTGCTVEELTESMQGQHLELINGMEYNVFVIRKVQLTPLQTGQLLLPETSVENKVSFYNAGNLNYRDLYYGSPAVPVEEQTVVLQNKAIVIDVKPLPNFPSVGKNELVAQLANLISHFLLMGRYLPPITPIIYF